MLASVPRRAEYGPLGLAVGAVEDPEEVLRGVSASECERVDLNVARRDVASPDGLPRMAGDRVLELVVPSGTLVRHRVARLDTRQSLEQTVHR